MVRPRSEPLTEREAQIMGILWRRGSATADVIRADLPDQPHDSTVRTLLRVLENKGYVTHRVRNRSYVYRAAVKREQAEGKAVYSLLKRFFDASPEALVMRLIEDEHLTAAQLDQLTQRLGETDSKEDGGT